jgi:hypothetical protein
MFIFCAMAGHKCAPEDKSEASRKSTALGLEMKIGANKQTNKLHGLSPRVNYTDQATAACRRSDCQLLRMEGATWSV